MLTEINQSEKDKYHVISLICESKEQNKQTKLKQTQRANCWLPEGKEFGGQEKEVEGLRSAKES